MIRIHRIIVVTSAGAVLLRSSVLTDLYLSLFLLLPPFLLLLSIVMFFDGSRCTDAIVERRVLHAFHDGLSARIDFFRVIATKGSRNRGSVIHPSFQFELPHNLGFSVGFRPTLGNLVSSHVWFVEIVDEIDGELDQEVALHLCVIRIVEPIVEIRLRSKPQHGVSTVLNPKGLLPFFHDDGPE